MPWMASFLSADKQVEVTQCLNEIAPMEKALQEVSQNSVLYIILYSSHLFTNSDHTLKVLVSWLGSKKQTFTETYFQSEELQGVREFLHMESSLGLNSHNGKSEEILSQMKVNGQETEDVVNRVNVLHLWHGAVKKDLQEILQKLHFIRSYSCFQNLDSILIQLKFLADVLIFYR